MFVQYIFNVLLNVICFQKYKQGFTYAASIALSTFLFDASRFDFFVSGYDNFDIARAQGAAITDAQIK